MTGLAGLFALGCGRLDYQAQEPEEIAAPGPDGSVDAEILFGSFGPAVASAGLEDATADDPTLTGDMLEIYFEGSGQDIWRSQRANTADPWSPPVRVDELSSPTHDSTPEITYDGLTIYLASKRGGSREVWRSTRASRSDPWGPVELAGLGDAITLAPMADGGDWRVGATGDELQLSRRELGAWSELARIPTVDEPNVKDAGGFLATDSELWFQSERGDGLSRIYRAVRADTSSPFEAAELVEELNLPGEEQYDPWLSPDRRVIYFVSRTPDGVRLRTAER